MHCEEIAKLRPRHIPKRPKEVLRGSGKLYQASVVLLLNMDEFTYKFEEMFENCMD